MVGPESGLSGHERDEVGLALRAAASVLASAEAS